MALRGCELRLEVFRLECCTLCEICAWTASARRRAECTGESMRDAQAKAAGPLRFDKVYILQQ